MDLAENDLTHLREVHDFSNLLRIHIIKVMPLELSFLFDLSGDFFDVWHLSKLP